MHDRAQGLDAEIEGVQVTTPQTRRTGAPNDLSAATDFDISQVVDVVKGVHARIRKDGFD
ncbi:hypothetical protein [Rhodococcus sp. NPDC047139]|uniref:hypothetical protein n=1 Tax=Rhodococcus sp. NPDC047139 TaxID=3155141 RepID=UPI0033DE58DD